MFVPPQDHGNYENYYYKSFAADLLSRILVAADVFIDVGAHCGYFSLLANSLHPNLKIVSIEPEPYACGLLNRSIALLNKSNIDVHQAAAFNKAGIAKFAIAHHPAESHFCLDADTSEQPILDVETFTLDSLLGKFESNSLVIKICTQGSELAVLEGLSETLKRVRNLKLLIEFNPALQIAAGHLPEALLKLLDELGFVVHLLDEQRRQFSRIHSNTNWQSLLAAGFANLYCVRREQALSVCFVSHSSGLSGAEQVLLELVEDLIADHGAVCAVVLPAQGPLVPSLKRAGAACIVGYPYAWWCSNSDQVFPDAVKQNLLLENVRSLDATTMPSIREFDPDIFWTQTMVIPWGAVFAAKLGKPHVWSVNEFGENDFGFNFFAPFPAVIKDILDSSELVFTCSNTVAETVFPLAPPDHVQVLYCHVDIPAHKLQEHQTSPFRLQGAVKLGIFGQVRPTKGQQDVVSAVARLLSLEHHVELLIAGGGLPTHLEEIAALIRSMGIEKNVCVAGFMNNPYPAMQECDILLVASHMEAFGRAGVEAMLLGKPVVFSDAGGLSEFMIDGETGLSYSPGDVDGLVTQLKKLLADQGLWQKMGDRGREHALTLFSKDAFSGKAYQALRTLSARGRSASAMPSIVTKAMNTTIPKTGFAATAARQSVQVGRNDLCPCGSGKKFKRCHGRLS